MIIDINNPIELWRYDLIEPADEWDSSYHSPEYTYSSMAENLKFKNQIGAFYLFDNKEQALLTGRIAKEKSQSKELWLTHTTLIPSVRFLDIRSSYLENGELISHEHPIHIIDHLIELGLDVFSDNFKKYVNQKGDTYPFSVMKTNYETCKNIQGDNISDDDRHIKYTLAQDINSFFRHPEAWNLAYIGQLLTDFENGLFFKDFLEKLGCGGYIFNEAPETPTYCILQSNNLSTPHKEIVT